MSNIRDSWQARVLCAARNRMAVVVPSILAHQESELMMMNLMLVCDPPCWDMTRMSLRTPFLCSIAKVNKRGQIVADVIEREVWMGPMRRRNSVLFADLTEFECELRWLADHAWLEDNDRVMFFNAARKWVGADQRLDPAMDPLDPDARRLVVH